MSDPAMTIPMGMSGDVPPSSASQDMLETLTTAERLFWDHLTFVARRGHVSSVREAAVCLALIRTFRTSLGRGDNNTPVLAAQLLGQCILSLPTSHRLSNVTQTLPQ